MTALQDRWAARWEAALAVWSKFTKLRTPRWCATSVAAKQEGLSGSFAMIRLVDHAVVIDLEQVAASHLERFATEVLAHEIGHHVYAPGDLADHARIQARIRRGLPGHERWAGMVGNLYTDLLINDRLQRQAGLDMAGVYRALKRPGADDVWLLTMRIYEHLWSLPAGDLCDGRPDAALLTDAVLGARVIRAYARDHLGGAGRFAALYLPYIEKAQEAGQAAPWLDAVSAGTGGELPDGLASIDDDELEGAVHPIFDDDLAGVAAAKGTGDVGPDKRGPRPPREYADLMHSLGVQIDEDELVRRYYRELALPHLIPYPTRAVPESTDPLPEGLDVWDPGSPLADVDWVETVVRSPIVIPGVTTMERRYGTSPGGTPSREAPDLYLGVDCSGSMGNPRYAVSYPVIAGAVIVLSALRAGARAMVCLSGEPGNYHQTDGFLRDERELLTVLTSYLGTGYSFGAERLRDTFFGPTPPKRPAHVLVVSDSDWFVMLGSIPDGWDLARRVAESCGAGATAALNLAAEDARTEKLRGCGWNVSLVSDQAGLVGFARSFSRLKYGEAA